MTTPFSIPCEPGAVVLVNFRFTSGDAVKKRPAVILSVDDYHNNRADAIMMALSTKQEASYFGDCDLADWRDAGLPKPTKAKAVIQTIERDTIERRLGTITTADFGQIHTCLKNILGL